MSYILEALADSEQARQQIAALPKYSLLPAVGEELSRHRRWPYLLTLALLVNAAVLQVWLRPSLPGSAASINAPIAPQMAQSPAVPDVPEAGIAPLTRSEKPVVVPEAGIAPLTRSEKPVAEAPDISLPLRESKPQPSQPERVDVRPIVRPPAPTDAVSRMTTAAPANDGAPVRAPKLPTKVMPKRHAEVAVAAELKAPPAPTPPAATIMPTAPSPTPAAGAGEMPAALQQELPALSVAGFIRDEGARSMVIVNDRLVREGDEVAPGVKLEQILNDGLVFSYRGYRFKR